MPDTILYESVLGRLRADHGLDPGLSDTTPGPYLVLMGRIRFSAIRHRVVFGLVEVGSVSGRIDHWLDPALLDAMPGPYLAQRCRILCSTIRFRIIFGTCGLDPGSFLESAVPDRVHDKALQLLPPDLARLCLGQSLSFLVFPCFSLFFLVPFLVFHCFSLSRCPLDRNPSVPDTTLRPKP